VAGFAQNPPRFSDKPPRFEKNAPGLGQKVFFTFHFSLFTFHSFRVRRVSAISFLRVRVECHFISN
jgi:hypothetical protein